MTWFQDHYTPNWRTWYVFKTSEVDGIGWMYYTTCGYIGLDDDYSQVLLLRLEDSVDNAVHEVYRMGVIAHVID